jgi:NAD(P)-dependent dehydrogenase (short-subunit alcohol dehydrogenase family)
VAFPARILGQLFSNKRTQSSRLRAFGILAAVPVTLIAAITALPIGRAGALEEVASTMLWLASPAASFVVGHDLVLDGGATA